VGHLGSFPIFSQFSAPLPSCPAAPLRMFRRCRPWSVSGSARRLFSTSSPPPPPLPKSPVSWETLALTLATGCGVVAYYNVVRSRKSADASSRVESYGKPMLGGPWSLVDASGKPVTSGDFLGKYVLLYFGFTFCPDICPNELVKMARVVNSIDESKEHAGKVVPMFITLDPYRDTCEQVGAYVADFHPRMVGLTGTPGQVAKAAKAYRVYFSEVDKKEGEEANDYLGEWGAGVVVLPQSPPPIYASVLSVLPHSLYSPPPTPQPFLLFLRPFL